MSEYVCHFCGKEIDKEEVLFVDTSSTDAYFRDTLRYNFLNRASVDYPFESGDSFRGLYFRCSELNEVSKRDENGFPRELRARPCDGLTPGELAGEMPDESESSHKPTDLTDAVPLRTRVCPHCHCQLPQDFGTIPTFSVCLFGGRAAGKTAYLLSLFQQLLKDNSQLSACQLGTVKLLKESETYISPQMRAFSSYGVTSPTPVGAKLFPLVLRYDNLNVSPPRSCFVALYDIAGEGLDDEDYLARHEGLRRSETIMLMLDPNMLCEGAYFHASNVDMSADVNDPAFIPAAPTAAHDFFSGSVANFLADAYSIAGDLNIKHIIAVVTKLDQPLTVDSGLFASTNCLLRQNNVLQLHQGMVNRRAFKAINDELKAFFNRKLSTGGKQVDISQQIVTAFHEKVKNPLLLGVSTHTKVADVNNVATFDYQFSADAAKHRIIEPFLAILMMSGMVPVSAEPGDKPAEARKVEKPAEKPKKKGWFRH